MANTYDLLLAINGELTDSTVEVDSASWLTKVGNVKVAGGGGSWWRTTNPFVAEFDMAIPVRLAHRVRTVAIAVNAATTLTGTIPSGVIDDEYRIIFHGDVQSSDATVTPDGFIKFFAVDEMSALMNRRARTAASNNSGIRDLLNDIETAHSLTINGQTSFVVSADHASLDRPKQKGASNGAWIRTALAGTGVNMTAEWETSITAPAMRWRPDWFETDYDTTTPISTTRQWTWEADHPWLYNYGAVGIRWQDFVARINLDGEDSAGNQYYGYAALSDATTRQQLGHRDVSMTTWMDNATDLQKWARRLLARVGEPVHVKMYSLTLPIEALYRQYVADAEVDADVVCFTAAAMMPGDLITTRTPFDDSNTGAPAWPAHAPDSGTLYDNLEEIWSPKFNDDLGSLTATTTFVIRGAERTYHPTGGWMVTYQIDPVSPLDGNDVLTYGSGTY